MSNLSQSDLILAGRFVDGDLPAHEAAQAEVRIAKDADFAAAVEQLRDQSALLGRLPEFTPSSDLADRTLQASMDQVKAIMGAWPIESNDQKVSVPQAADKTFDWKSTAALLASLAGLVVVGAMLLQNNIGGESNVAMSEPTMSAAAPIERTENRTLKKGAPGIEGEMDAVAEQSFAADDGMQKAPSKSNRSSIQSEQSLNKLAEQIANASPNAVPGQGVALSGTPMRPAPAARQQSRSKMANQSPANASTPVSQIWYVSQDSTASKADVCDILNSNQIAVQREEAPQSAPDAVEAFYVAATPKQLKLALSQISNNADIAMIEIPIVNSPIADAIQKQYTQSKVDTESNAGVSPNRNLPPNFQRSLAMGQQLFSNRVPRGIPGPVPPILESDELKGLDSAINPAELAMDSNAKVIAPPASKGGAGFGGAGGGMGMGGMSKSGRGIGTENATPKKQVTKLRQQAQKSIPPTAQQAELDKLLDDSVQLQQYLILVRGGEKKSDK